MKRIIVLCDGTWETALFQSGNASLTNIARLASAILPQDARSVPPIPQVKLYLPGIGSGEEAIIGAVKGAYGTGLLENVRLAYYFVAQNWAPGDEVALFGFSRGAYAVRLLSTLISFIGILSPLTKLHLFTKLFELPCVPRDVTSSKARKATSELNLLLRSLEPDLEAQRRAHRYGFPISIMVLFDTVPLLHHFERSPFGTFNTALEPGTCRIILQVLSAYENRPAYRPLVLEQSPAGLANHQTLRQVWFPGCHTDIGGGYPAHDLSDLTFHFLIGELGDELAFDATYAATISSRPEAPWGAAPPHVGVHLSSGKVRLLPTQRVAAAFPTFQSLHPSLLKQPAAFWPESLLPLLPTLQSSYKSPADSDLWWTLNPWERSIKRDWHATTSRTAQGPTQPHGLLGLYDYERRKIRAAGDGFSHAR
ncbi:hypothetical protein JCM8202_000369 [Rhodotorula sphaerocarpa]